MSTEAETISDLALKSAAPAEVALSDGRRYLVTPNGAQVKDVSDEHGLSVSLPRYIKQTIILQTRDSLVDYVTRFKNESTLLFADIVTSTIVAAVDYHNRDAAHHVAHRATLSLAFSEEWLLWSKISGQLKPQLEFARFIEENAADVRAPSGADLLETVRDLQAHRKVNFTKAVRTASDNESFEFSDETKATTKKGDLEIPTKFQLGLPVYFGESETELFAFLRWKLDADAGGLALGIALHRAEQVRQAAFKQIVIDIGDRTDCAVVFGKVS